MLEMHRKVGEVPFWIRKSERIEKEPHRTRDVESQSIRTGVIRFCILILEDFSRLQLVRTYLVFFMTLQMHGTCEKRFEKKIHAASGFDTKVSLA